MAVAEKANNRTTVYGGFGGKKAVGGGDFCYPFYSCTTYGIIVLIITYIVVVTLFRSRNINFLACEIFSWDSVNYLSFSSLYNRTGPFWDLQSTKHCQGYKTL